ncbi:MAG TPA: DUF1778 domain-containing protein [Labilithrix sp.]|jgi:uncharacterized protein (DUF1778 family)|nr:DUF1778 domain-containing protein [Labilithrix sp.]
MAHAAKKTAQPLSLRLADTDLALIDRAAELRGRSRTDFMREAALRAAEEVIMDRALIRMSGSGFAAFAAALAGPPASIPALVEVMKRKAPWER